MGGPGRNPRVRSISRRRAGRRSRNLRPGHGRPVPSPLAGVPAGRGVRPPWCRSGCGPVTSWPASARRPWAPPDSITWGGFVSRRRGPSRDAVRSRAGRRDERQCRVGRGRGWGLNLRRAGHSGSGGSATPGSRRDDHPAVQPDPSRRRRPVRGVRRPRRPRRAAGARHRRGRPRPHLAPLGGGGASRLREEPPRRGRSPAARRGGDRGRAAAGGALPGLHARRPAGAVLRPTLRRAVAARRTWRDRIMAHSTRSRPSSNAPWRDHTGPLRTTYSSDSSRASTRGRSAWRTAADDMASSPGWWARAASRRRAASSPSERDVTCIMLVAQRQCCATALMRVLGGCVEVLRDGAERPATCSAPRAPERTGRPSRARDTACVERGRSRRVAAASSVREGDGTPTLRCRGRTSCGDAPGGAHSAA